MFDTHVYAQRRSKLRALMGDAPLFFPGHREVPRNYRDNTHNFRQNSTFAYFAGHQIPDMALLMTPQGDILCGYNPSVDDIIWTGPLPSLKELGEQVGIDRVVESKDLPALLADLRAKHGTIHYLPPFQGESVLQLCELLGLTPAELTRGSSPALIEAVVSMRNVKEEREIQEIEKALGVSLAMYTAAARACKPGNFEYQVKAAMVGAAMEHHCAQSFHPILTIHGEVLHNHSWENKISGEGLFLLDSGAETPDLYASDITRVYPISGTFSALQRDVYQIVLDAQLAAINMSGPGVSFRAMHLEAALVIARGLTDMGLMKGDPRSAVESGAHALFFPHGLGHMMGMDVHDMEDLGDMVGYGPNLKRDSQFGLAFLRMGRVLESGYVFTVEPGIYFIPALIEKWNRESINKDFINFGKVQALQSFGGIRIEDDILVTPTGHRVLGAPIPKTVSEIESLLAAS
ncbi:aminopeptidase P family protein [Myxococcota bacterium]|nr:aminopeptidase P family protein [Myxococcota bacterium]MBU1537861.1 aminopeptidase P family protein [Myxococcota bacterium]